MISYRAAVASALGQGNRENGDNFYFNTRYLTEDLIDSQVLLSHKKSQKGLQIYAVSDGTGAESYDEEVSAIVIKNLLKYHKLLVDNPKIDVPNTILDYIDETNKLVNRNIRETGNHNVYGTLALLCVESESTLICSVGDSRVYKFSRGRLKQLTEDHTQAQKMVSLGLIDQSKASSHIKRNKLTQYFGEMPEGLTIDPFMDAAVSNDGDVYLLCTKGFYETVSNDEIAGILSHKRNPSDAVDELMAYATDKGLKDDATIIVVFAEEAGVAGAVGGAVGASAATGAVTAGAETVPTFKSTKTTLFSQGEEVPAEKPAAHTEEYHEEKEESADGFFASLLAPFRKGGVKDPNKFWPSLLIFAVCILALILLAVFGYNMFSSYRSNTVDPTKAPVVVTATPEPETPTPVGEITPFAHTSTPTKDPNATPTPSPTPSPTPTETPKTTPTPTPSAKPTPTPTKAPTPTPAPTVTDISVTGQKTTFAVGEDFSKGNAKVHADYSDGSSKIVTNEASFDTSAYDKSNPGTYPITVSYGGKSTTYNVTVTGE